MAKVRVRNQLCEVTPECRFSPQPAQNSSAIADIYPHSPDFFIGYHNLLGDVLRATGFMPSVDSMDPVINPWLRPEIVDSPLTEVGKEQCRTKRQFAAKHLKPELIIVSALTRAIQTAQLSFEDFQNSIPWIVVENTREETGMLVCNKRRPLSEVKSEFPSLTFEEGMTEEDTLFTPDHRESHESKSDRIYSFLSEFLASREETEIAVVGHSAWLHHMLNSEIVDCSDAPELQPWFNVAEIRSVKLTFTKN